MKLHDTTNRNSNYNYVRTYINYNVIILTLEHKVLNNYIYSLGLYI